MADSGGGGSQLSQVDWVPAGRGLAVWDGRPVEGRIVEVRTVEDVLSLMDEAPDDMIVLTYSASATILSPLYDVAVGIICTTGTVGSHVAIISREYGLPCIVGATLTPEPVTGYRVRLEPSGDVFMEVGATDGKQMREATDVAHQEAADLSEADFSVLHFIRLKGIVPVRALATVASALDVASLVGKGVMRNAKQGVMLTETGLERHKEWIARQRNQIDLETVASSYDRFLVVNQPVKDACAKWQHSKGNEEDVIVAVEALVGYLDRVRPALQRAGGTCSRFLAYSARLDLALDKVQTGHSDYLTAPSVDSFHNIWFECHEDYLMTLGRDRETEEGV